ncbi:winged helix-turn-helix transcriptional regulator [Pedobacter antarcticus]|uniref:winged helix-turn-helix transcriptional regulator n=1 Tax=Pedobacter antarcticus TaxID=34086 RepID=UPI001C56154D|nr:helix-turn-helix domain-containing protein [Pedobacter antarcticus]
MKETGPAQKKECTAELMALRDSLDMLAGKWTLPVLQYLANRQQDLNHFGKLERGVAGISPRMLTRELKMLELNKMIVRTLQQTKPVTVTYAITSYGLTTLPIIRILVEWGKSHRAMLKAEQNNS